MTRLNGLQDETWLHPFIAHKLRLRVSIASSQVNQHNYENSSQVDDHKEQNKSKSR